MGCVDGIGSKASLHVPTAMCLIPSDEKRCCALLIPDERKNCIRCVFPAPPAEWITALTQLMQRILVKGGALPVMPLVSIILEFTIADSE